MKKEDIKSLLVCLEGVEYITEGNLSFANHLVSSADILRKKSQNELEQEIISAATKKVRELIDNYGR